MSELIPTVPLSAATPDDRLLDVANADRIGEILPKLAALESALIEQNPNINGYMKAINENLRQYPELLHLLTREQQKPIYTAIRQQTKVVISAKLAKKKPPKVTAAESQQLIDML